MTGMACRTLLSKVNDIMDEITVVCMERRKERVDENLPYSVIPKKNLKRKLQLYRETFQLLDAVFGGLRTIAPTANEIETTLEAIVVLEHYWVKKLKLSITPKAHLAFKHSVKKDEDGKLTGDMIVLGGIGDKTDEWGEKWHQTMHKAVEKVRGLIGFRNQSTTIIKHLWRDSDPSVRSKLEEGLRNSSRGPYNGGGMSLEERRKARLNVVSLLRQKVGLS